MLQPHSGGARASRSSPRRKTAWGPPGARPLPSAVTSPPQGHHRRSPESRGAAAAPSPRRVNSVLWGDGHTVATGSHSRDGEKAAGQDRSAVRAWTSATRTPSPPAWHLLTRLRTQKARLLVPGPPVRSATAAEGRGVRKLTCGRAGGLHAAVPPSPPPPAPEPHSSPRKRLRKSYQGCSPPPRWGALWSTPDPAPVGCEGAGCPQSPHCSGPGRRSACPAGGRRGSSGTWGARGRRAESQRRRRWVVGAEDCTHPERRNQTFL